MDQRDGKYKPQAPSHEKAVVSEKKRAQGQYRNYQRSKPQRSHINTCHSRRRDTQAETTLSYSELASGENQKLECLFGRQK